MGVFTIDFTPESLLPVCYRWLQNIYVLRAAKLLLLCLLFSLLIDFYLTVLEIKHPHLPPSIIAKHAQALPNMQEWHLFGSYQIPLSALPASQAPLHLIGILAAEPKEQSQAIIAADGTENVYQVGQTLPNGAVLKQVLDDSVIIEQNGHQERLSMPKTELDFQPAPSGF